MTTKRLLLTVAPAMLAALLAGCAAGPQDAVGHHHGGAMDHGHGHGSMMDMNAMCDMHRQMMGGKTPQERQALIDEHMKSMPPEMREHVRLMDEQCK